MFNKAMVLIWLTVFTCYDTGCLILVCVVAAACTAFGMTVKGLTRTKKESTIPDFDVIL